MTNSMNVQPSFFIVDDHMVSRQGLKATLATLFPNCLVTGEANSIDGAVEALRRQPASYVFLDHAFPEKSGLDLIRELSTTTPGIQYALVTQCDDSSTLAQYQRLGVKVMLSKLSAGDELKAATQALLAGNIYHCPVISRLLEEPRFTNLLTPREIEVVRMIAQGKTNKEVAHSLSCSEHTVKTHKTNVMRKLNLSNAVEISVWALKRNLA